MKLKRVSILGATGSIGDSTLDIVLRSPDAAQRFQTVALTAHRNVKKLVAAAKLSGAEFVAVADESLYQELKDALSGTDIEFGAGDSGVLEAAQRDADLVVSAITGVAALKPTLAAVERGATIALANKESLVCAGDLFLKAAAGSGSKVLPVDSEHNAMFQVLDQSKRVEKLVLTASGGPFRQASLSQMATATPEQALKHPNWSMGAKISIDSATMMNKALELIEAAYLFSVEESAIDVLVHPQSIVHGMVTYDDGSVLAQLGTPDMRTPISYALSWPDRMSVPDVERLDLATLSKLEFFAPDDDRFPALSLARRALSLGGWGPAVFNAANEIAVEAFLNRKIGFLDITSLVRDIVDDFAEGRHGNDLAMGSFEDVYALDQIAREASLLRIKAVAA